ncbi:hypothetical protein HKD37_20G055901 [Glycine soja]
MEAPETIFQQRGGACRPVVSDAILPRKGPITRTMSKRLQEDWARAAEEGPRVLMNLKTHLLLEVVSPLSLPSPFHCHSSSKKQRNPLMKKILGLQAPFLCFWPFSFRNLTKLYRFHRDEC